MVEHLCGGNRSVGRFNHKSRLYERSGFMDMIMRLIVLAVMAMLYGLAWHDRPAKESANLHIANKKQG